MPTNVNELLQRLDEVEKELKQSILIKSLVLVLTILSIVLGAKLEMIWLIILGSMFCGIFASWSIRELKNLRQLKLLRVQLKEEE